MEVINKFTTSLWFFDVACHIGVGLNAFGPIKSLTCIHVDFDKASFASLAELQLSPLYPCDTWPAEWLHTANAQCTHPKHCTVHSTYSCFTSTHIKFSIETEGK